MTEKDEKFYVFSAAEIKILLSGIGYENVMGFFHGEKDEPQYSEILNVILNLVNQKIIGFDAGKMYINESLTGVLSHIGDSTFSASVTFPVSGKTVSYYFDGDSVAVCEPMVYQKDRYIVRQCSISEFFGEFFGNDDMEKLLKNDSEISEKNVWKDNLNTVALIEVFRKYDSFAEISIRSHAFGNSEMTVRYANGTEETADYSEENFVFLFEDMMQS